MAFHGARAVGRAQEAGVMREEVFHGGSQSGGACDH
jgi:hypothetical protein